MLIEMKGMPPQHNKVPYNHEGTHSRAVGAMASDERAK